MKKSLMGKSVYLSVALVLGLLLSGCGGGGGGGGTPAGGGSTTHSFPVNGTFSSAGGAREAGRTAAAPVANTRIIAYTLGDGNHRALNNPADTTDAAGNYNITVVLGTLTSANIIIEALPAGVTPGATSTIKVALENASANTTANADETTATEAQLWAHNANQGLAATIKPVVALMADDVKAAIRSDIDTDTKAAQVINAVKSAATACSVTADKTRATLTNEQRDCIITNIETQKASVSDSAASAVVNTMQTGYVQDKVNTPTAGATTADRLKILVPDQTYENINAVIDIADKADQYQADAAIDNIMVADKAQAVFAALAPAITAYKAAAAGLPKYVAAKAEIVGSRYGTTISNSSAASYLLYLELGLNTKIGNDAVGTSTAVSKTDLNDLVTSYDYLGGMLVGVYSKNVGLSRDNALNASNAFLNVLAGLGDSTDKNADKSSLAALLDGWVGTENNDPTFLADLYAVFDPLGMDVHSKTAYLMNLIHDLSHAWSDRTAVLAVLTAAQANSKVDAAAVTEFMRLYDKYIGGMDCAFDTNISSPTFREITGSHCITQAEIVHMMALYYGKTDLPKLDAFLTGIQQWAKSSNDAAAIALKASNIQRLYNQMKTGSKTEVGAILDAAGIKKEILWLVMNVEAVYPRQ